MSYISQINAFERWLENNYLPPLSQLIWYKLLMLSNRAGWPEWVTVENLKLMALIGIKREATFIHLRDKLLGSGWVEYRKGRKGFPNSYRILLGNTFTGEVETVAQTVVQTEVETVAQTVDLYRHKTTNITSEVKPPTPKPKKTFSDDSREMKLARGLSALIQQNKPDYKLPTDGFQGWCRGFDLLLRVDKRNFEEVKETIVFAQQHHFWHKNILSADTLRKQYDRLRMEMEDQNGKHPG